MRPLLLTIAIYHAVVLNKMAKVWRNSCFFSIFLLLLLTGCGEMKMMVEGKTCEEDYPWVKVYCKGDDVDQPCWNECQSRHGPTARAWCKYDRIGWNVPWCGCFYPC